LSVIGFDKLLFKTMREIEKGISIWYHVNVWQNN